MAQVGFAKWIQDEVDTPDGLLEWTGAMGVSMLLAAPVLGAAGLCLVMCDMRMP